MAGAFNSTGIRGGLFSVSLIALMALGAGDASAQTRVNAIAVDGNARIPTATVISLAEIEPGAVLSDGQINDALQRVIASGFFESVNVATTGSGLRFDVVERPTINRINIEGNRRIDDDFLIGFLTSQSRRVYSPSVAEADAAIIVDAYAAQGRLAATVTPKIIRRTDNRVDLVFEVTEGNVVENERISFVGNRAYSDRRLRRALQTKQAGFLRSLIRTDTFLGERIEFDRRALSDFYNARGFVDFQVLDVTTEFSRERDASFITFNIREGQSFDVGEISVTSEFAEADVEEYRQALRLRSGETWNPARIDEQIARLERLALQQGLDFLRVDPRVTRNARNLTLDVEFALVRGPRVFVERIDIEGNTTTLDRVIRRQFDSVEGDPFNPREIRNAAERIRALGFFSNADVQTREGSASDQVVVDVDVEEQPTGSLTFGGTFSSDTGFALIAGFSERNFLGRGQLLAVSIESGTENGRSTLRFREPAFLDRDLAFGLRAEVSQSDYDTAAYETELVSVSPSLEFPVSENGRLNLYYEIAKEEVLNVSADASPIIAAEEGEATKSALGYTYTLDLLRGGLNPTRGMRFTFGQEFAGVGGDVEAIRTTGSVVAEQTVWNDEVTLRAILRGGLVAPVGGGTTRVSDRFFLSSRDFRGFQSRGVGPRDEGAVLSDVLGGNKFVTASLEADFPLGLPEEYGITGGVFFDVGSVWDLDNTAGVAPVDDSFELRSSVGFSIFWTTPIGPLRLNFARPIDKNPLDVTQSFDLTISTQF